MKVISYIMGCWYPLLALLLFLFGLPSMNAAESTGLNPCELEDTFMYCDCNVIDPPEEAEKVTCSVFLNSSSNDPVWLSLHKLTSAVELKLQQRRERQINYLIPSTIFGKMRKLQYFYTTLGNIGLIPSFAFSNSSTLDQIMLENNNISRLEPFAFANLNNLTILRLSENSVNEINRNVFVNLPILQILRMSRNSITTIHDSAFVHLNGLEELELQKNRLTTVVREVFSGLGKLKRLYLSHNTLDILGDYVFSELKSLNEIDLDGNRISFVSPSAFDGLGELGRLNLKENKITQMSASTFSPLYKLHFLDLRDNLLESLDIRPIQKRFLTAGQLMVEGNHFKCTCHIMWMQQLYNKTSVQVIRDHLGSVDCELPQKFRQLTTGLSTEEHTKGALIRSRNFTTVVAIPPEQATAYALDSTKQLVANFAFSKDLNCHSSRIPTTTTTTANPIQYDDRSLNQRQQGKGVETETQHSGQSLISNNKNHHHHHHDKDGHTSSFSSVPCFPNISFIIFMFLIIIYSFQSTSCLTMSF